MSNKRSPEEPATPASRWRSWAQEHPGLIFTVGGFVFVIVKLLVVSKFNPAMGLALATSAGPGQVFLGLILLGYPFLLVALALGAIFQFSREVITKERPGWSAWPLLLVAFASLMFVDLQILAVLLASLAPTLLNLLALPRSGIGPSRAVPGIADLVRSTPAPRDPRISTLEEELESEKDPSERARIGVEIAERQAKDDRLRERKAERRSKREKLRFWLSRFIPRTRSFLWLPPSLVFLVLTLSPQMWLPPELVNVGSRRLVVYVVDVEGAWTTLLRESDRTIVRVRSELVTRREICQLDVQTKSPVQLIYRQEIPEIPVCFPESQPRKGASLAGSRVLRGRPSMEVL